MKSIELISQLNEDPALRREGGITAGQLANRLQTLIEMGKLDRDAPVVLGDLANVVSAVAEDDGELLVLSNES